MRINQPSQSCKNEIGRDVLQFSGPIVLALARADRVPTGAI